MTPPDWTRIYKSLLSDEEFDDALGTLEDLMEGEL